MTRSEKKYSRAMSNVKRKLSIDRFCIPSPRPHSWGW